MAGRGTPPEVLRSNIILTLVCSVVTIAGWVIGAGEYKRLMARMQKPSMLIRYDIEKDCRFMPGGKLRQL